MKTWNKILGVLVLLLIGAVGFLFWKINHLSSSEVPATSSYQVSATPPPVPPGVSADEREAIQQLLAQFQAAQQQFADAQAVRDQRLEEGLRQAREGGREGEAAQWQQALVDHRAQWKKYQEEERAWREDWKRRSVEPGGAPLPPPPTPPLQSGPEPGGRSGRTDQEFATAAGMVVTAICIVKPPLCVVATLFKGLLGKGRDELLKVAEAVALGKEVDPSVVDAASKLLRQDPKAREAFLGLLAEQAKLGAPESPWLTGLKERLAPVHGQVAGPQQQRLKDLVGSLRADRPCGENLSLLQVPERFSAEDRRALELLLAARPGADYVKLWTNCLAPLYGTAAGSRGKP
jgi:hypothetical protein